MDCSPFVYEQPKCTEYRKEAKLRRLIGTPKKQTHFTLTFTLPSKSKNNPSRSSYSQTPKISSLAAVELDADIHRSSSNISTPYLIFCASTEAAPSWRLSLLEPAESAHPYKLALPSSSSTIPSRQGRIRASSIVRGLPPFFR